MSYVRCRKVQGKHHMYCPVRKRAVVLGKDCDDGDVAHLLPSQVGPVSKDPSWKVLESIDEDEVLAEEVGEPTGILVVVPKSGGWYDVQNTETGEIINTTSLRLEDANEFIAGYVPPEPEEGDGEEDGD